MADDIVTRLREGCIAFHDCDSYRNEAADEIERLRIEVARLALSYSFMESELNNAIDNLTRKA